jgi:GATA-binding protein, other eukaryote
MLCFAPCGLADRLRAQPVLDSNDLGAVSSNTPPPSAGLSQPRQSHHASSGASDRSRSPISRLATPSIQHDSNIAPHHLFDGAALNDHHFQPSRISRLSPSLPSLQLRHPSPGSSSSLADRHLEPPQTYDQLYQSNSLLKTRVNELELINMMRTESEARLQKELDAVRCREDDLKRRLGQLEQLANENSTEVAHPPKRTRLSEISPEDK